MLEREVLRKFKKLQAELNYLKVTTTVPYGRSYLDDNAVETTINTIGVYELLAGTWANGSIKNMTSSAVGGRLIYTGNVTKHFHIVSNLDVTVATNNQVISFQWFKNGNPLPVPIERFVSTGADLGALSIHADVMLATDDYLELKVTNVTSTANLTCKHVYVFVMGMAV